MGGPLWGGAFTCYPACLRCQPPGPGCFTWPGPSSGRFSMVIEDGIVKTLNVEPDGTGLTCSLAPSILSQL